MKKRANSRIETQINHHLYNFSLFRNKFIKPEILVSILQLQSSENKEEI